MSRLCWIASFDRAIRFIYSCWYAELLYQSSLSTKLPPFKRRNDVPCWASNVRLWVISFSSKRRGTILRKNPYQQLLMGLASGLLLISHRFHHSILCLHLSIVIWYYYISHHNTCRYYHQNHSSIPCCKWSRSYDSGAVSTLHPVLLPLVPVFYKGTCRLAVTVQGIAVTSASWYITVMTAERFIVVWLPMKVGVCMLKSKTMVIALI